MKNAGRGFGSHKGRGRMEPLTGDGQGGWQERCSLQSQHGGMFQLQNTTRAKQYLLLTLDLRSNRWKISGSFLSCDLYMLEHWPGYKVWKAGLNCKFPANCTRYVLSLSLIWRRGSRAQKIK